MEGIDNMITSTCASLISVVDRGAGYALDVLVRFANVAHLREVLNARSTVSQKTESRSLHRVLLTYRINKTFLQKELAL
jgi:hypothetical protein